MSLWTPLPQNIASESIIPRLNGKMEAMVRQLVRFSPKDALTFHQDAVAASQSSVALEGGLIDEAAPYTPTGGEVLIQKQTISGSPSTIDFTTGIDSTYAEYVVRIRGLVASASGANLLLRVSPNAGSSWDSGSTDYYDDFVGANAAQIRLTNGTASAAGEVVNGEIRFFVPANTSVYKMFLGELGRYRTSTAAKEEVTGVRQAAAAINGVRLLLSSGTFSSGEVALYGVL